MPRTLRLTDSLAAAYSNAAGAVAVGDIVAFSGSAVVLADATDQTKPAQGIVVSLISATESYVAERGSIPFSAGTVSGQAYYLDTVPGRLRTSLPANAGNRRQAVGVGGPGNTLQIVPYDGDSWDSGKTRFSESRTGAVWVVDHNLGLQPIVHCFDDSGVVLTPASVVLSTVNRVTITFGSAQSGTVLCIAGSDLTRPYNVKHVGTTQTGDGGTTDYLEVDSAGRQRTFGGAAVEVTLYTCTTTEAVGDWVYISGADNVRQANASASTTAPAIGRIVAKPTTTTCLVQRNGTVRGLSGLTAGAIYFLAATAGSMVVEGAGVPNSTNNVIQMLGRAKSTTEFECEVDFDHVVIVNQSSDRALRMDPTSGRIRLAPTAFSGISGVQFANFSSTDFSGGDMALLGLPGVPVLPAGGLALRLLKLSASFRTTSPSSCSIDCRAYVHRAVAGVYTDDEIFRIVWTSNAISANQYFALATIVNRSASDLEVAGPVAEALKVSNAQDTANEAQKAINSTSMRCYQTFRVPTSVAFILTKIRVFTRKVGNLSAAALKCNVADLASQASTAKPKQPLSSNTYLTLDSASAAVAASTMTTGGAFVDFDYSGNKVFLKSGAYYAFVCEPVANGETIDATNRFDTYVTTDTAYANGGSGDSSDSGATWSAVNASQDVVFEIHGQTAEGYFVKLVQSGTSQVANIQVSLDMEFV